MRALLDRLEPGGEQGRTGEPGTALLLTGLVLLAANLRPSIAMVSPLLPQIRLELDLNSTETSLLTALPVLLFGAFAPTAPLLSRLLGANRAALVALGGVLAGSLIRLLPGWLSLVAGTCLLSAGIAVGNVLLPSLARTHFPNRIGPVTGLYTMGLNVSASAAAATIVPLAVLAGGSWREGMLIWTAPLLAAIACWVALPSGRRRAAAAETIGNHGAGPGLLRSRLAWSIIVFTASQSVIYYCILSWLPSIYQSNGESAASSGVMLSVATLVGAPVALAVPALAARFDDQRLLLAAVAGCAAAGLAGLALDARGAPVLWAVLIGVGQGGAFPLALAFFALKTSTGAQTARLSMLAQTFSYLLASLGPFLLGFLFDQTHTWTPGIGVLIACLAIELLAGLNAARPVQGRRIAIRQ